MKKRISEYLASLRRQKARAGMAMTALAVGALSNPVLAALPTPVAPAAGTSTGNFIGIWQQYLRDGFLLLGLVLSAAALYQVAGGGVAKFTEFRSGKAELGEFITFGIIGVALLVLVIYLTTEAAKII